jgi:hypothetical protein
MVAFAARYCRRTLARRSKDRGFLQPRSNPAKSLNFRSYDHKFNVGLISVNVGQTQEEAPYNLR